MIESFATGKLAPFVATLGGGGDGVEMGQVERALMRFLDARGVPAAA